MLCWLELEAKVKVLSSTSSFPSLFPCSAIPTSLLLLHSFPQLHVSLYIPIRRELENQLESLNGRLLLTSSRLLDETTNCNADCCISSSGNREWEKIPFFQVSSCKSRGISHKAAAIYTNDLREGWGKWIDSSKSGRWLWFCIVRQAHHFSKELGWVDVGGSGSGSRSGSGSEVKGPKVARIDNDEETQTLDAHIDRKFLPLSIPLMLLLHRLKINLYHRLDPVLELPCLNKRLIQCIFHLYMLSCFVETISKLTPVLVCQHK